MSMVRSLAFNIAFIGWTVILGVAGLPLLLLAPRPAVMRFGRLWDRGALALLRWIVGLDHEVRGLDRLPRGGCIIAVKHQSAWDTLILPIVLDDPAVVMKRELLHVPFYGWYAARAGSIAVDRKAGAGALRAMVKAARPIAAAGRPIVIFPEGTRTAPGARSAVSARRRRPLSGAGLAAGPGGGQLRAFLGAAKLCQAFRPDRPRIPRPDPAWPAAPPPDGRARGAGRDRRRRALPRGEPSKPSDEAGRAGRCHTGAAGAILAANFNAQRREP